MLQDKTSEYPSFDLPGDRFRELGYQVVDLMAEILESETSDPVLRPAPGERVRSAFDEDLPRRGSAPEDVLARCRDELRRYGRKNGHPRFFAYVCASADPLGALADALASTLNQIPTSWRSAPSATEVERLVVRWLDIMVGFEGGGRGLLVSGGSAANANALACAVARGEEQTDDRRRFVLYLSREAHMSFPKAARELGLKDEHVRRLGVDERRRLVTAELDGRIAADRAAGLVPLCAVASAGTANTGAIDPLLDIAGVCEKHGVWLHVDGAYGAPAVLVDDYRWMAEAFARADSLSLDPHKWLFAPFDVGCVLVRDEEASRRMFSLTGEYAAVSQTDPIERYAFFDHGPELSRRFRALKVWMILKVRGVDAIASVIDRNVALRQRLDARIAAEPRLEALGSELSICCYRYVPEGLDDSEALNALNRRILETLNAEGSLHMSPTTLDGRYALRASIVNFRTTEDDVDFLVDSVLRVGRSS